MCSPACRPNEARDFPVFTGIRANRADQRCGKPKDTVLRPDGRKIVSLCSKAVSAGIPGLLMPFAKDGVSRKANPAAVPAPDVFRDDRRLVIVAAQLPGIRIPEGKGIDGRRPDVLRDERGVVPPDPGDDGKR